MEKKIAPSEQKAQALRALLQGQAEGQSGDELLSALVRLSTERILQEALEQEQAVALESVLKKGWVSLRDEYAHANIPDGPDNEGMGTTDEFLSPCLSPGPPAQMGTVADSQCDSLCHPHGLSVAHVAAGLSAVADRVWLLLAVDAERAVGTAQHRAGEDRAAASGTQSPAQCGHYRQSECEDLRRRRSPRRGCPQADAMAASAILWSTCWDCC